MQYKVIRLSEIDGQGIIEGGHPGVAGQFAGRIAVIDDLQRLEQLHRSAVQVNRLDDFQRLLDAEE